MKPLNKNQALVALHKYGFTFGHDSNGYGIQALKSYAPGDSKPILYIDGLGSMFASSGASMQPMGYQFPQPVKNICKRYCFYERLNDAKKYKQFSYRELSNYCNQHHLGLSYTHNQYGISNNTEYEVHDKHYSIRFDTDDFSSIPKVKYWKTRVIKKHWFRKDETTEFPVTYSVPFKIANQIRKYFERFRAQAIRKQAQVA